VRGGRDRLGVIVWNYYNYVKQCHDASCFIMRKIQTKCHPALSAIDDEKRKHYRKQGRLSLLKNTLFTTSELAYFSLVDPNTSAQAGTENVRSSKHGSVENLPLICIYSSQTK